MLTYVLIALAVVAVLILALVVVISMRPGAFRIARSTTIAAPSSTIFPHVNDLHAWEAWSPFEKIDPNMTRSYEGPRTGVGASQLWSGNSRAGEGRSTITESHPSDHIRLKLEFKRPMKATNTADFTFEPDGNQTVVTWCMTGENGFMGKAFTMFVNMDKMLGGEFDKGLASLKAVAEGKSPASAAK
jgi:hypothetical protein